MNLSLLIVIVLVAIVIPWIIRYVVYRPSSSRTQLLIPEHDASIEEPIHETSEFVSAPRTVSVLDDLGFKQSMTSDFKKTPAKPAANKYLSANDRFQMIHVMAEEGKAFAGYELLQTLSSLGFHYGPMRIFHFYRDKEDPNSILFSLASAVEPGVFDLEKMAAFTTPGVSLFMDKKKVVAPAQVFQQMVAVAEQLADEMGGELRDAKRQRV